MQTFGRNYRFYALLLLVLAVSLIPTKAGYAQTTQCDNGTLIEVEGRYPLDTDALCAAAQPWTEEGIQVVIYITDFRPETEEDWYDHLDAMEVDLGLISADRTVDNFTPNVFAIEATTGANRNFGTTVTFGSELYDTPIDSDTAVSNIKATMLDSLQREQYTAAFVHALEQSYTLNYPPPSIGDYLINIALIGLGLLVALAVLNRIFGNKIKAWWRTWKKIQSIDEKIESAQEAFTNLRALLNGFIAAPTPEESLLYRIYFTNGADKYDELLDTAVSHLQQTQETLRYITFQPIEHPDPENNSREQQLIRIQTLYLQLIGTLADHDNLTDDALRQLFEPFFTASDPAYASELAALQPALQKPLTYTLDTTPEPVAAAGIMDDVLAFKNELERLQGAQEDAAPAITSIQQEIAQLKTDMADLDVTPEALLAPIETIVANAQEQAENGRYLDVEPTLAEANQGLELLKELNTVWNNHTKRQQEIVDAGADGFYPPILMTLENELTFTVAPLLNSFTKGDYDKAQALLIEFEINSEYALQETIEWQTVYQANIERLKQAQTTIANLHKYQVEKSTPAWQQLTAYNKSNWEDLAETATNTAVSLQQIEEQTAQCTTMNAIDNEVQQFDAVDTKLTVLLAQLAQLEFQLETIVYRLEEVQAAESSLEKAIELTNTELKEVIALRDAEDAKISPAVDQQIQQAQEALNNAESFVAAQNFRSAIVAQSHVRQLARQAHSTATTEIDQINKLLTQMNDIHLHVDDLAQNILQTAQEMPEVMLTTAVSDSAKEAEAQWSVAQILTSKTANKEDKAWADALEKAIIAYQVAEKALNVSYNHNQAAKQEYDQLLNKATKAKEKAQSAIKDAETTRRKSGVGSAGESQLHQAQTKLSNLPLTSGMPTKETLNRIIREANHVEKSAKIATKLAREAHQKYQARQRSSSSSSSWGSSSSSSSRSSWSSSSSSRSSSFSSSSSSSRSSGSTSSRRRR